jgi:uncharacterized membrane protein YdbT with pleckstrin-like domain
MVAVRGGWDDRPVGFPDDILTDDEEVVLHLHPHWIRLVLPALAAVIVLGLAVLGVFFVPDGSFQQVVQYVIIGVGLILLIYLSVMPWIRWITTSYVITNERVLIREGVLTRTGRDIPLVRINDVTFHHTLPERMIGSGTLTIESAGERGQVILAYVPRVEHVHLTLYELAEAEDIRRRG